MYSLVFVKNNVMGSVPQKVNKKVKLTAKTLYPNTLLMASNNSMGKVFSTQGDSHVFNNSGGLFLYSFLKPEFDAGNGLCLIGKGTSYDKGEDYNAAELIISYSNTKPLDSSEPTLTRPRGWCWTAYIKGTGFYIDLNEYSGGMRYCHIKVKTKADDPQRALIEGNVFINIAMGEANTPDPEPDAPSYAIYTKKPIDDGGSNLSDVENSDIFIDFGTGKKAYLVAMIGAGKVSNNRFNFEVGDPKDDAVVVVEEV